MSGKILMGPFGGTPDFRASLVRGHGEASSKAELEAFMAKARVYKPAMYAFCSKLRAGVHPSTMDAAAMLQEAGVSAEEARPILREFTEVEDEPRDDAYERLMASLKSFRLGS